MCVDQSEFDFNGLKIPLAGNVIHQGLYSIFKDEKQFPLNIRFWESSNYT
jgi:hypothetical protein